MFQNREGDMTRFHLSRRDVLRSAAAAAAIAALGIDPSLVLGADEGVQKIRMNFDIQVLDPGYMVGSCETMIVYSCMPRLAVPVKEAGGTWGWRPSDYVENVNEDDATHISFTLKPGLMWSNDLGELTSADVKFSLERMLKSDWSSRWPTLDHVAVKDRYSGTIVLKAPFVATWLMGVASDSGTIVPRAAVEKMKDQKYTIPFPGQLGPYMMVDWTPKQKVVLKANPDWKGTKPYFQEVHMVDVENFKAAELALEVGELDVTAVPPDTAARYMKSPPPHSKLLNQPGPYYTWMGMNTQNPKLQDVRVRKAIQRAIDVESILLAGYAGVCPKAYGVVPIGDLGHRDKASYSFNPDEAKSLLKDAGISDLSLEIKALSGQAQRITACQIIQSNLGDVGITVNVTPVDSGQFWNLGQESKGDAWKTLELWIMHFNTTPDPADAIQWFRKNQIGIWNWERWSDPEFEALWDKGLVETDRTKRAAIYVRMQEIMENTGAYVWITFDPLFYAYKDNLRLGFNAMGDPLPWLIAMA
jgi:peptide/nickel transport system substrate-binding protein